MADHESWASPTSEEQPPRQSPWEPGTGLPPAPPPPPYPYAPYGYMPYAPPPPTNTYAILAAIFAFVVFPPLGIYFGTKAKQQIEQTGERGIELAKVGVIGGWIMTSIQAAFLIIWCSVAGTMMSGFFTSGFFVR